MRFDRKPPDDDLLLDPIEATEEPADEWEPAAGEPSLLADFQPDSARDGAAVAPPPADGDDAYLFSATRPRTPDPE